MIWYFDIVIGCNSALIRIRLHLDPDPVKIRIWPDPKSLDPVKTRIRPDPTVMDPDPILKYGIRCTPTFCKFKHVHNSNAEIKMSYCMQKVHESTFNSMVAFPWFLATSRAAVADASALNASVTDGQKPHCIDDHTATWTHYWSTDWGQIARKPLISWV